ncbi:MAG: agmatine deiminase family protein, partial [Candidatus Sulfotelmatobacter sp.]
MPRSISSGITLDSVPANLRFRTPAEWEPHAATWLAWPHYRGDWPGKFEPIPWVYTEIIRNLARRERVELVVNDAAAERKVRKLLEKTNAALA